jgi:hypothetical protein
MFFSSSWVSAILLPTVLLSTVLLAACGTAPAPSSVFVPPETGTTEDAGAEAGPLDVAPSDAEGGRDAGPNTPPPVDVRPEDVPQVPDSGLSPEIVAEACEWACIEREQAEILELIREHVAVTGSVLGQQLIQDWDETLKRLWRIAPAPEGERAPSAGATSGATG